MMICFGMFHLFNEQIPLEARGVTFRPLKKKLMGWTLKKWPKDKELSKLPDDGGSQILEGEKKDLKVVLILNFT